MTKLSRRSASSEKRHLSPCCTKKKTKTRTKTLPKSVRFREIDYIEFPMTLGDNPSVHSGPPVTCDWKAQYRTPVDIELFERFRTADCERRKRKRDLVMEPERRDRLLLRSGVSSNDILDSMIAVQKAKLDRTTSIVHFDYCCQLLAQQQQKRLLQGQPRDFRELLVETLPNERNANL